MPRRLWVVSRLAGLCVGVAGCGSAAPSNVPTSPASSSSPGAHAVVTFEVAGHERFKVEVRTPELVAHAEGLLKGEPLSAIPIGKVARGSAGVNTPWSWHLDPATVHFAFVTVEVCDGLPFHVEDGTVTSDDYCPWSAKVVAVEPMS